MSTAEHRFQILEIVALYNGVFELWLAITFAFVLSIHFTSSTITRWVYFLLNFLYIGASVIFVQRYINLLLTAAGVRQEMTDAGLPYFTGALGWSGIFVAWGMLGLMTIGTIGSICYAFVNRPRGGI